MKPFFSYYGAKYIVSGHLGPPRNHTVVEPFAGSACYSTRWNAQKAMLYDISPDVCDLWHFLINCSETDITDIPDSFEHMDEVLALPRGAQLLVRFWVAKGRAEPTNVLSPWYFTWRGSSDCRVWGPAVKARIIAQKPFISKWQIDQCGWDGIPVIDAHWHVDPPYNNSPGSRYPFSEIDFAALSEWCRNLPGEVDVCENLGADWLPFKHLCNVVSSRGRRTGKVSQEALWRNMRSVA